MRGVRVRRVRGDEEGVDAVAHALLRVAALKVRALGEHGGNLGGEDVADGALAGDQLLMRGVAVQGADVGLELQELLAGLGDDLPGPRC